MRFITYLFILLYVCSCNSHMVLHSFDNAIDISLKNKENAIIAVGDINITEEIRALQLNEIFKDHKIYACDITLPENIHANYIYEFEMFPSIIIINSNSEIVGIASVDDLTSQQFANELIYDHICESNTLYKVYKAIKDVSYEELRSFIDSINVYDNSFYKNYLGYQACLMLDNDMQDIFIDNAIINYIDNPESRYSLLFSELLEYRNSSCAEILINEDVDIGEIQRNDSKEYKLRYINLGQEPLYIFHVTASCNCVKVNWDRVTEPETTNEMIISISASKNLGDFAHSIFVSTNTLDGGVFINLHGKII